MKLEPELLSDTVRMDGARAYTDQDGNTEIIGGEAVFETAAGREYLRCNFSTLCLRYVETVNELAMRGRVSRG